MNPTNKLRFVEREVPSGEGFSKTVRVLQQWWAYEEDVSIGEWRDVPLEEEE